MVTHFYCRLYKIPHSNGILVISLHTEGSKGEGSPS
jgi:hypothetical protein